MNRPCFVPEAQINHNNSGGNSPQNPRTAAQERLAFAGGAHETRGTAGLHLLRPHCWITSEWVWPQFAVFQSQNAQKSINHLVFPSTSFALRVKGSPSSLAHMMI